MSCKGTLDCEQPYEERFQISTMDEYRSDEPQGIGQSMLVSLALYVVAWVRWFHARVVDSCIRWWEDSVLATYEEYVLALIRQVRHCWKGVTLLHSTVLCAGHTL